MLKRWLLTQDHEPSDEECKEVIQSCLMFAAGVAVVPPSVLMTANEFTTMAETEYERLRRGAEFMAGKKQFES